MRTGQVQNFGAHPNGTVYLEATLEKPFEGYSKPYHCWGLECRSGPPIADHHHFTGRGKPWLHGPPANFADEDKRLSSASQYWFYNLAKLNEEYDMKINFATWKKGERPLLGMYPTWSQVPPANTNITRPLIIPDD